MPFNWFWDKEILVTSEVKWSKERQEGSESLAEAAFVEPAVLVSGSRSAGFVSVLWHVHHKHPAIHFTLQGVCTGTWPQETGCNLQPGTCAAYTADPRHGCTALGQHSQLCAASIQPHARSQQVSATWLHGGAAVSAGQSCCWSCCCWPVHGIGRAFVLSSELLGRASAGRVPSHRLRDEKMTKFVLKMSNFILFF